MISLLTLIIILTHYYIIILFVFLLNNLTRVRGASAASMPHLMQSLVAHCQTKGGNPQVIKQRFDWLLPDLLKCAKQEPDIDLIYVMVVAVHEVRCIHSLYKTSPNSVRTGA